MQLQKFKSLEHTDKTFYKKNVFLFRSNCVQLQEYEYILCLFLQENSCMISFLAKTKIIHLEKTAWRAFATYQSISFISANYSTTSALVLQFRTN